MTGVLGVDEVAVAPSVCPRCGAGFRCGAQGPGPCACTGLTLAPETLQQLQQRYHGCLCLRCLAELAAPAPPAPVG